MIKLSLHVVLTMSNFGPSKRVEVSKGIYGTIPTVISDELDQVEYGSRVVPRKNARRGQAERI